MKRLFLLLSFFLLATQEPAPSFADLPPLIPRRTLLAGWDRGDLQISPDGSRLSWIAGDGDLPPNIWISGLDFTGARRVTSDDKHGLISYRWSADGRHLLYFQDAEGDENWHLFRVDLETGVARDLTPFPGVRAQDLLTSDRHPEEVLVSLNRRDPRINDLFRVNLETGDVTLEAENPGDIIGWAADPDFTVLACTAFREDASTVIRVKDGTASPWRDLMTVPFEDGIQYGQMNGGNLIAGFAGDGRSLFVVNSLGAERTRLVEIDRVSGREVREIARHPRSDVEYAIGTRLEAQPLVLIDPVTAGIQAVGFNYARLEWQVTDPSIRADIDTLQGFYEGTFQIVNRVRGDSLWLVHYERADGPDAWYLYDRATRKGTRIRSSDSELSRYELAPMDTAVVRSRDGFDILCYVTAPPGVERKNLPMVMIPHGGPWWRDRWIFDPWVQLLANRGYVVIQPQYRGSTGFGKKFLNASNRQFGNRAIMGDFVDVVNWAVDSGLADRDRLAVMGGSAGGYAALCCITFQPDLWRCAVDVVGPSSVRTLLQSIPEYWKPVKKRWVLRFGDAENDDEWERSVSPLHHAKNIRAPLFMAYGLNDPRVHIGEAEQMATAMRANELPLTFVVYPDEGHQFARIENNDDFFGRVEEFLAEHLGGRKEPWRKVEGSSVEVR